MVCRQQRNRKHRYRNSSQALYQEQSWYETPPHDTSTDEPGIAYVDSDFSDAKALLPRLLAEAPCRRYLPDYSLREENPDSLTEVNMYLALVLVCY